MAKSTKPKAATTKKVEPVIETPKEETVEIGTLPANPKDDTVTVIDMPKSEAIEKGLIQEAPPSVTLEEVKEVEEFVPEPVIEVKAEPIKEVVIEEELSIEDRIVNFIDSRGVGNIKMNDFLKSLFPTKFNEPPVWLRQSSNRQLRAALVKLQSEGKINIENNRHLRLGQSYYSNSEPETKYYNLNSVQLVAIK